MGVLDALAALPLAPVQVGRGEEGGALSCDATPPRPCPCQREDSLGASDLLRRCYVVNFRNIILEVQRWTILRIIEVDRGRG